MKPIHTEIFVDHDHDLDTTELRQNVAEHLDIEVEHVHEVRIVKQALDARRRHSKPKWRLKVQADVSQESAQKQRLLPAPKVQKRLSSPSASKDSSPVIIVGAGPAGLFAAWHLAENGAKVILLERGKPVETRARDCGRFRSKGELDLESNLSFGEGGAGTYSDGKLYTRKNNPLIREVLERLVEVGGPARILTDAKPHIGTNLLFRMLQNLRNKLISYGADVRFETKMERLQLAGNVVSGIETAEGVHHANRVILATGHSARDTFYTLLAQGIPMEAKPFAVGVRAEHPQYIIDDAQYRQGRPRPKSLPAADYRLAHTEHNRGVYSFCMCPGGMIVPTATEAEMVVVNGMSTAKRSSPFANSGLVVQVNIEDFKSSHPLAGVEFQRKLERAAYAAGGNSYAAPAIRISDFVSGRSAGELAHSHFRPALTRADLNDVFPSFIVKGLRRGLKRFDSQLRGYVTEEGNLIGAETRTSSPIRIPRDKETFQVEGFDGLYVAGEGPGYAGGIMSAAIDGLNVAHRVLKSL
ncbi:MAG: FAD-dependent oxidoreductase [Myxococcota bacterium]|nr:FAD-dependent oxidoreductase [Myxococcota bacterium]